MYNERNLNKGILFGMLIVLLYSLLGSFTSNWQDTTRATKTTEVVKVIKSDADIQREIAWARKTLSGPICHYGFPFMEHAHGILKKYNAPMIDNNQNSIVNLNTKPSYIQKASFTEK